MHIHNARGKFGVGAEIQATYTVSNSASLTHVRLATGDKEEEEALDLTVSLPGPPGQSAPSLAGLVSFPALHHPHSDKVNWIVNLNPTLGCLLVSIH